jgi:CPA1 family monovalent cation:H+ antiporter
MSLFDIAAILMTLAALFGYLNHRYLRLEPTVGLMLIALVSSLTVILLDRLVPGLHVAEPVREYLAGIDFNEALMHGMLGFLLFAGALHVDLDSFLDRKATIASLATGGLLLSMVLVALLSKGLFTLLGLHIDWLSCFVFGALISPTDPIAVMGTLKTLKAPPSLEAKIAGESLFNDGVAVVVFTGLVALLSAKAGTGTIVDAVPGGLGNQGSAGHLGGAGGHGVSVSGGGMGAVALVLLFLREAGGGGLLGLLAGYVAYRLMLSIDDYKVEVLISLALVMGSYSLAWALHVSGPIAVVCAGLLIGNRGRALAMSYDVADYLEKFWELIDEFLNAVLFLLIGIEVVAIAFSGRSLVAGLIMIAIVLLARLVSVGAFITLLRRWRDFSPGVVRILTWGGLRGGISVALVLSLPPSQGKPLLITCTYIVVLFSILVQGLTIKRVLRKLMTAAPGSLPDSGG